jgi:hypothetical protein
VSCFFMRMFVLEIASHPSTHTHFQSHTKKTCKRSRCPFTVSYVFFRTILIVEQESCVRNTSNKRLFSLQKYFEKRQLTPKSKTQKKNRKQKRKKKKEKRKERTKPWIRRRMQQKKQTNPEKRLCFRSLSLVQV